MVYVIQAQRLKQPKKVKKTYVFCHQLASGFWRLMATASLKLCQCGAVLKKKPPSDCSTSLTLQFAPQICVRFPSWDSMGIDFFLESVLHWLHAFLAKQITINTCTQKLKGETKLLFAVQFYYLISVAVIILILSGQQMYIYMICFVLSRVESTYVFAWLSY